MSQEIPCNVKQLEDALPKWEIIAMSRKPDSSHSDQHRTRLVKKNERQLANIMHLERPKIIIISESNFKVMDPEAVKK